MNHNNAHCSDCIRREDAKRVLNKGLRYMRAFGVNRCLPMIDEVPSADVRENVRGEWIRRDSRYVGWISFDCSVCGETLELDRETSNDFKYCPFCGAEMGGGRTEE